MEENVSGSRVLSIRCCYDRMNNYRDIFLNQKDGVAVSWLLGAYLKALGSDLVFHKVKPLVPSTVSCVRGGPGHPHDCSSCDPVGSAVSVPSAFCHSPQHHFKERVCFRS